MDRIHFERKYAQCYLFSDPSMKTVPTLWLYYNDEEKDAIYCWWPVKSENQKSSSDLAKSNADPKSYKWQPERVKDICTYSGIII